MKKTWRDEFSEEKKLTISYGRWDYEKEDFQPMWLRPDIFELRILDIKEYDPIILDKNFETARPYEYFEGDLNEVSKNIIRNERLSPELMIDSVPMVDNKFMLIQDKSYRVYFDHIFELPEGILHMYDIIPTAKALNYGFIMQSPIILEKNFNPVIPFYDNELGYILSTNLFTPVTVNIPLGTKLAYLKRIS